MGIRCLRLGCLATLLIFLYVPSVSGEIRRQDARQVGEHLSGIGIPFIANSGQTDPAVAYYAQTFAGTVFGEEGWLVLDRETSGRECPSDGERPLVNRGQLFPGG